MGDYQSLRISSPSKGMKEEFDATSSKSSSPVKNPLAVASLTSNTLSSQSIKQVSPPSRSQPFSCPSLDETLLVHGASAPAQTPQFRLQMRQEPERGLAVGNDESAFKNARVTPLDPPPICELVPERSSDVRFISVPELSVQACLVYSESPFASVANSSKDKDPMMSGLQECGFIAPISGRHEECLFVFSELGIRTAGEYRIRFDLIDRLGCQFRRLTHIYTQPFTVVSDKKNFAGLSASTELIHSLVRRGLKLRIIKAQSVKPRKRKKVDRESVEATSVSGQSVPPSPLHAHRQVQTSEMQPQREQRQQQQQQQQQQQYPQQQHKEESDQPKGDYRQQQSSYTTSEWTSQPSRQHSHLFLNPPQRPHGSQHFASQFHTTNRYPPHDEESIKSPSHLASAHYPINRDLSPYPHISSQRITIPPSLSPSTGSKSSTDSAHSFNSTSDEEHHFRRLPAPQIAYLTSRNQPNPNYNESSRGGGEEDSNRPFRPLMTNRYSHQSESGSSNQGHSSFSRLDLSRLPSDDMSHDRPILPPLRSINNSPPSR